MQQFHRKTKAVGHNRTSAGIRSCAGSRVFGDFEHSGKASELGGFPKATGTAFVSKWRNVGRYCWNAAVGVARSRVAVLRACLRGSHVISMPTFKGS